MGWRGLGVRAMNVLTGGRDGWSFFVDEDTGNVFDFAPWHGSPIQVGGPGADFAINDWTLYGVSDDGGQVWGYSGTPMQWYELARPPKPVHSIFGGGGLLLCSLVNGRVALGAEGHPWRVISDEPARWIVVQSGMPYQHSNVVYALRDDMSVQQWFPEGGDADILSGRGEWRTIRAPGTPDVTRRIVTGGGLDVDRLDWLGGPGGYLWVADVTGYKPSGRPIGGIDIYRQGSWQRVGGPGARFAANKSSVYGLSPDRGTVYKYAGNGDLWHSLGGPPDGLQHLWAGGWSHLFGSSLATHEVFMYDEQS